MLSNKIKDIALYQKKSKIKAGEGKSSGKYPFFTSSNILSKYVDNYTFDGEFLIFGTGGSASVNYYNGKFSTSTDNFILKIKEGINTKYIYYYLKNNIHKIEKGFKGAGLKHLSKEHLDNISVPIPDIKIQNKIVESLDKVYKYIDNYYDYKNQLNIMLDSKYFELISNDEIGNYKDALGNCTDFIDYRGGTPKISKNGTIRVINAKSVGEGYFRYIPEFITEELYKKWMHRGFAYPGDILFVTEGATFGNVCLIPEDLEKFALGQRVITIQGKKDIIDNNYLFYYMRTPYFKKSIKYYMTGGTAKGIKSKDLSKIEIPIPEFKKQQEFSKLFNDVSKIINKMDLCIEDLKNLGLSIFYKELNEE